MEARKSLESMKWKRRSLLTIEDLAIDEIIFLLEQAKLIKEDQLSKAPPFFFRRKKNNQSFMEPSTAPG